MKSVEQTPEEARAVELFRALANPVRFRILQSLAQRGECVVGDLVLELPVAQSTVSEHLKVLREAGIVTGTVEGPSRCYCIDPAALEVLRSTFDLIDPACCAPRTDQFVSEQSITKESVR